MNVIAEIALRFFFCTDLIAEVALRFNAKKNLIAKIALRFYQYKNQVALVALRFMISQNFCALLRCTSIHSSKMPIFGSFTSGKITCSFEDGARSVVATTKNCFSLFKVKKE